MRKPFFHGPRRWLFLLPGLFVLSILLVACGENSPSILNTAGPVAENEGNVFWVILIIATIIFVGVEGALIYSIIRYRERPGMERPKQIHGSLTLEMVWTILPALILFIVLYFTIQGLFQVATPPQTAAGDTIQVTAVGHQWWWEFYYPEYKITTADTLHVPTGKVVEVKLFSNNVIHSFWIPNLTGKTDVVPGHDNTRWFKADKNGEFLGICAEFCGTQHANMKFNVVSQPSDDFQTWVRTQQQAAAQSSDSLAQKGKEFFTSAGCNACHGIVGVNMTQEQFQQDPAVVCNDPTKACLGGPNLTHFGSRNFIAGGVLTNNSNDPACNPDQLANEKDMSQSKCNLARWLHDPQGIKPGNDMQVSLSNEQITALVAYLESLK